jgi:Pro-kumamolisin, activation domain/Bacterial Ig-like domain (group 3)
MPRISLPCLSVMTTVAVVLFGSTPASPQPRPPAPRSRVLQAVDDAQVITLSGNTHPFARPEFDQGALADATPLRRIVLMLQRSPEQELALQQLIDHQQDKTSSAYHQWLTPETFGATFGPTDRDLSAVTTWLSGHGFSGIQVNSARTLIQFDGTAGTVHSAFRTGIHGYAVNGERHFANASDPSIPAALAPVVAGIASLNNFPRRAASHKAGNFHYDAATKRTTRLPDQTASAVKPAFTINESGNITYGVTPYDFATIYNVLPLWNAATPIDGTGQTIAIVGQSDINPADFVNFRKLFGLPLGDTATPTGTQYLNIIYNGPNPGITGDEGEADIDTQWSGAVAKGATIDYVVSQGTEVTQGTDLSAIYIVNNNLAPVMSYSYGQCELFLGASGNAFYKTLWQQAAAQGITVLNASGDSGVAGCDTAGVQGAGEGLAVNGLASTPYNTAVGGTDFYMPNGGAAFWNTANASTQASAKGYIPEIPWNETCTNSVFATSQTFSGQTPEQICNSTLAALDGLLSVVAAGGGSSSCTQSNGNSVFTCKAGYAKPSWQTGPGVPADGVRDIPDVSLFSSSGFFGAFYIVCQQSTNADGQPCSLNAPAYDFAGYGGTSLSTPAFAGILSLVNQKTGSRQGNANYVLYNLAAQQNRSGASCNSITGAPASGCVFNDVTTDTIAMPCLKSTPNCTVTNAADHYGVLSGYASTPGYDLATGLGSVNAANLVNSWSNANFIASSTTLTLSQSSITHGSQVSASVKVSSTNGTPTGNVSINALASNGSVQNGTLQNGSYTASLGNFPGGSYSVQAHYAGDGLYAASDSNSLSLTVSPESSTTTLRPLLYNPATGATTALPNNATSAYGAFFLLRTDVAGASGQGTATGNVLLTDSGAPLDGGIFRLNSTSNTEDQARALAPGTHVIAAAYTGDASFNASTSSPVTLSITKGQTVSQLQVSNAILSAAGTLILTAQVNARGFGAGGQQGFGAAAPGGTVSFTTSTLNLGAATLNQNSYPAVTTDSSTISITIPASLLLLGTNAITVSYAGDANYISSVSPPVTVVVTGSTQVASVTSLSLSANAVLPGDPFSFTATVAPRSPQPNSPQPTGSVTFTSDSQPVGQPTPLLSGIANLSGSSLALAPGTHLIAAIYSGDTGYQSSISAVASLTVGTTNLTSTTTIALTPSSAVQGAVVTVAASIAPATPAPIGTVQLMLDGNLYGSPVSVAGATTNLPLLTSTLQPGTHIVRVLYSGDSSHQAGVSAAAPLTILESAGAFTLSPATTSTTALLGKSSTPVTLTATPSGGFHSAIAFACTGGLPSGAVCLFTPSTIDLISSSPQATVLTISPAASTLADKTPGVPRSRHLSPAIGISLAGVFLILLPKRTRRLRILTLLITLSTLGVLGLSGCGSGGIDPNGLTPGALSAGSYTVTVTATGASTIQTATINLTIQ